MSAAARPHANDAEGRAVRLLSKPFEIETLQKIVEEMAADVVATGR
jgi:hypothetical protein